VPVGPAEIHLYTRLHNAARAAAHATVTWTILSPDGKTVAKARSSAKLAASASLEVGQTTRVSAPELWSPESPKLYRLRTQVSSAGKVVDQLETEFGIRSVAFDPRRVFC
jgi:beta-galactosidase